MGGRPVTSEPKQGDPSAPSWLPSGWVRQAIDVPPGYSLAETCGPVAWAGGRWPDQDWVDGHLVWLRADEAGPWAVIASQPAAGAPLVVRTPDPLTPGRREALRASLGLDRVPPPWSDPVIAGLAREFPGLRPFCHGSAWLGLLTSIVGQSISVASAATTQGRVAALAAGPMTIAGREFRPLPDAGAVAGLAVEALRGAGLTWRRAEAIHAIARIAVAGDLPSDQPGWPGLDLAGRVESLRALPLVGPWTARSTLLWGLSAPGAWPAGDVALLRAARLAYADPNLALGDLPRLASGWEPDPGWASRLLWAGLFGPAPATMAADQDERRRRRP